MARIHSGVPALISKNIWKLIKPSSIIIIKVLKKDGILIRSSRLDEILKKINSSCKKGAHYRIMGRIFLPQVIIHGWFKHPIIELVDPRQGRAITKRGRIVGYNSFHQKSKSKAK